MTITLPFDQGEKGFFMRDNKINEGEIASITVTVNKEKQIAKLTLKNSNTPVMIEDFYKTKEDLTKALLAE